MTTREHATVARATDEGAHGGGEHEARPLRLYISADMEGVAGVVHQNETVAGNREYEAARALMVAEVNTVVEAALSCGATEIIVSDGHATQRNIPPQALHEAATLVRGRPRPLGQMAGLTSDIDALLLVGYHARKGVGRAVLDHTMWTRTVERVVINGREVGEIGLNAALAGAYGVPMIFVAGDRAAADEAGALVEHCVTVSVKEGLGRTAAKCMHPKRARALIASGVRAAIERRASVAPFTFSAPLESTLTFTNSAMADVAEFVPSAQRIDGKSVLLRADDYITLWGALRAATLLATTALGG